ncbi:unnamed protein product [Phytophthora fragariaefolia]|uniref:Unnamed protein product n=1 Tax=Phytophthora fragariaefolia TaxID=1490495 RepID=A0A9W6UD88_9STRA|nr:unnamed protein product [Phytophthora fragariaefolia]
MNSKAQDRAPSPSSKLSGSASDSPPPDTDAGNTTGPQAISVDRANAIQTLGVLTSGQGSTLGMPVEVEIPSGEPSRLTVRVVGVPATESHNDGRTFLQDGFGGLEALVQMESLGATELAVLYDFFDDNDIIGDFILTPPSSPSPTPSIWPSGRLGRCHFSGRYDRIKRKLVEDDGAASVIELQEEVLRLKRDQQFHTSYWIEKVAEAQRERNAAVAQMRLDFVLLMEERERDISSLHNQVQTLKGELEPARVSRKAPASRSQGPRLRTAHVMNFLQEHATVMMNWPQLRDLLDHLEPGTQVPQEWQTVIAVMANDNLAFQAPPFVRMDPPQDKDDDETKESDPLAPDSFLDLSRGASTTNFRSKSSQLGKRASGSQSPKSNKKQAPDDVQELPSEWVGPSSERQAPDGRQVGVPGCSGAGRGRQVSPLKLPSGRPHQYAPVHDALASFGFRSVDEVRPPPVLHGGFGGSEGLRRTGTHMPEWRVTPGPSLDDGEIDLLESEDEAEDKAEKDEDYNPHQDQDDGVDDEDEIPDDASDDGVLNAAQRTTKRRRLSQSSAGVSTPKKIKTKSPVKTKVKVGSLGKSKSGSGSSKKPKPKSGGSRRRNSSTLLFLQSRALSIWTLRSAGSLSLPVSSSRHGCFPDFVPNRHDLDILKERCDGEELKAFLATRPWTKLSDTRRTEFFFHCRADLGHVVVRALEDWVDFMEENVEALWHATHGFVLDRDSTSKFIRKTSVRRLKLHGSVRKKVIAREKQLKKVAPASVWNEPGLWKLPKLICYWVLMSQSHTKPGTNANYSLREQVELLDAREPARLQ